MYTDLTDWNLVALAKRGEDTAFEEILRRYQPLVNHLQGEFYLPDMDRDEWQQEARIVLWKAVQHFNVTREKAFGSYYKTALLNRRRDLARRAHAKKRSTSSGHVEIDANPELLSNLLVDTWLATPDQVVIVRDTVSQCQATQFSNFERLVHEYACSGLSIVEIAASLNADGKQVKNALARIKKKLRNEFR
ncbi:sigma-70 family RNA polymerase sigma factor [Secundilactobacillus kimchicus]|uniref:RNA polymerase sigma-70 ECF-like HTH domain-containing protein n=1 Tax=Secundilactobacillus kimchicus JCM 15530 TaxID=1302272 RepID=A0A0R1HU19_9LACO|nr:sigma-70 family RNA polymerase sigma factor [Secundilactobacillus kimchicus]KRK48019.1 hypothetical protein FC96_GL001748 [Secundilactobacillus kimchicus JCM 15530]